MMKLSITTTLRCPIEDVFNYITNHYNEPLWNPDVKSVQDFESDTWGLGATCTMVFQSAEENDGNSVSAGQLAELLVTSYRPHVDYAFRSTTNNYVVLSHYRLSHQRDTTTRLVFASTVHLRGVLMKTIMRVPIHRSVMRSMHRNFDNLKAILESNRLPKIHQSNQSLYR